MNKSSRHLRAALLVVALLAVVGGTMLLQGCASPLKTKSDLDTLTDRRGLGHVYYIGTKDGFHYFASTYFLERTKYYRLPESGYSFQHPFLKTSDESKWIPFMVNLNQNTQGFRDELKLPLQTTNSPAVPHKRTGVSPNRCQSRLLENI